jgi:hypothetical protein
MLARISLQLGETTTDCFLTRTRSVTQSMGGVRYERLPYLGQSSVSALLHIKWEQVPLFLIPPSHWDRNPVIRRKGGPIT